MWVCTIQFKDRGKMEKFPVKFYYFQLKGLLKLKRRATGRYGKDEGRAKNRETF